MKAHRKRCAFVAVDLYVACFACDLVRRLAPVGRRRKLFSSGLTTTEATREADAGQATREQQERRGLG